MPIYKMNGKKDGRQKYRVRINYQDGKGTPRQIDRVVYGSEEAKLLEMQLSQSIKQDSPSKKITVKQLFDEYIAVKQYEVRESTLDKSRRILEYHILPYLKDVKLDKLSLQVLQEWKLTLEKKNLVIKPDEKKSLAIKTKQNAYGEFRALLNYAVRMEYIPKNPLLKIGNFKTSSIIKEEIDFYTPEEFKKFISKAREYAFESNKMTNNAFEWNFYVFFNIAFYTGLRKGEIHALRWSDIQDGYLTVKRSITQKLKGEDRETPPKNKSSIRTLQLPIPLINILNEHYTRWSSIEGFTDEYKVCGGTSSLRDTTIQKRNELYSSLANLKTIRIHDFRHSHASLLANEGINIQEIARRLGHAKIEMTWNTYSHLYPREEERAVNILNKIV